MFIRCTTIKSKQSGEPYKTHRLVETERVKDKVKQHTLLNLGRHFDVPQSQWRDLSARIAELLNPKQGILWGVELDEALEARAQRYAAQILASRSQPSTDETPFESVDVDSLELVRPRRVGIEKLALHAMSQLKLSEKLKELGFNRHQLAAAMGNIIARMAFPASERASLDWLQQRSGLGELIGYDFDRKLLLLFLHTRLPWRKRHGAGSPVPGIRSTVEASKGFGKPSLYTGSLTVWFQ